MALPGEEEPLYNGLGGAPTTIGGNPWLVSPHSMRLVFLLWHSVDMWMVCLTMSRIDDLDQSSETSDEREMVRPHTALAREE